jgi:hypothetical protein
MIEYVCIFVTTLTKTYVVPSSSVFINHLKELDVKVTVFELMLTNSSSPSRMKDIE